MTSVFFVLMTAGAWWVWVLYARPAIKPRAQAHRMNRSDRLRRAAGASTWAILPVMFTMTSIALILNIPSNLVPSAADAPPPADIWPAGLTAVLLWTPLLGGLILIITAGIVQTVDRHTMRARNRSLDILTPPPPWWTWAVVLVTLTVPTVVDIWVTTQIFHAWYADLLFQASTIRTAEQAATLKHHVEAGLQQFMVWTASIAILTILLTILLGIRQRRRRRRYFHRVEKAVAASANLGVLV